MIKFGCDRIEKERNQHRDEAEELRGNVERITKLKVRRRVRRTIGLLHFA